MNLNKVIEPDSSHIERSYRNSPQNHPLWESSVNKTTISDESVKDIHPEPINFSTPYNKKTIRFEAIIPTDIEKLHSLNKTRDSSGKRSFLNNSQDTGKEFLQISNDTVTECKKAKNNMNEQSFKINDPVAIMERSSHMAMKFHLNDSTCARDPFFFVDSISLISPKEMIDLEECEILGSGDFGIAYKYFYPITSSFIVVKQSRHEVDGYNSMAHYIREAAALSKLNHPNIVSYIDSFVENKFFYIRMEYCNWLDFRKIINLYLNTNQLPSESNIKRFLKQMLSALEHIHGQGIIHLDIRPENIFSHNLKNLSYDARDTQSHIYDPDDLIFKIGDFSQSYIANTLNFGVSEGDARYLARESLEIPDVILTGNNDTNEPKYSADIFGIALTTAEYAGCGKLPGNGNSWHIIRDGFLPPISQRYSLQLTNLLTSMISPLPTHRPTSTQCLTSEYLCND